MNAHEKAAEVLDTPKAALKTTHTEFTPDQRLLASLSAQLALAGHLIHKGTNQDFTVIHRKFGMSRYCEDFAALQRFASIVGVKSC